MLDIAARNLGPARASPPTTLVPRERTRACTAALSGNVERLRALLKRLAAQPPCVKHDVLNVAHEQPSLPIPLQPVTPLFVAVTVSSISTDPQDPSLTCAELLLSAGADPNVESLPPSRRLFVGLEDLLPSFESTSPLAVAIVSETGLEPASLPPPSLNPTCKAF